MSSIISDDSLFRKISLYVFLYLVGILSSTSGTGGGIINVSILLVIGRIKYKSVVVLSLIALFGNLTSQVAMNIFKYHPHIKSKPLIYWELILLFLPIQFLGSNLGVILESVLPETSLLLLAILTLMFAFMMTMKNFSSLYFFETLDIEYKKRLSGVGTDNCSLVTPSDVDPSDIDEFESLLNIEYNNFNENSVTDIKSKSSNKFFIDSKSQLNSVKLISNRNYGTREFPWTSIQVSVIIWILYSLTYFISRNVDECSWSFVMFSVGLYPTLIVVTILSSCYLQRQQLIEPITEGMGEVSISSISGLYYIYNILVGILCSLLGLGGGELLGPLLLNLKVLPEVVTATTSMMSLIIASSTIIYFISKGTVPVIDGIIIFVVGSLAGITGRLIVFYQIKYNGRPSVLVFCLATVIALSIFMNIYDFIVFPKNFQLIGICK